MTQGLVLDASVVINILGSGRAKDILGALGGRRIVVAVTSREVHRHPLDPKANGDPIEDLVTQGLLDRMALPEGAQARFLELVGASPPDDLDDGEAAALATGELLGLTVAIDERKGRRIARERMGGVALMSSVEVFRHKAVSALLGDELGDAVFSALFHARMRVLDEHDGWVRRVIGAERARECPSLRRRAR